MAKRKNEMEEENVQLASVDSWKGRFDGVAREYLAEMERTGGDLVRPGKGCIASVDLDCIYSYAALSKKHNKKVFVEMLQDVSATCQTAKILAYCVLDETVHLLIKGNRRETAKAFVDFLIKEFTSKYNRGFRSVGNPFRSDYSFRVVPHSALSMELARIHSLAPDGIARRYPFCSYRYLMTGEQDANLILRMELDPSKEDFEALIEGMDGRSVAMPAGAEKYEVVKADIDKNFRHQQLFREKEVDFMLGEKAARSNTSLSGVVKKMGLTGRYDLVISTVCDFIERRKCTYADAVSALGLSDTVKLRVEVIAEINRVHHYSYDYIMATIMGDPSQMTTAGGIQPDSMLVFLFTELNRAYGYTFEQLCVRFHITQGFLPLRSLCGL